jgi:hypothetical protein
MRLRMVMRAMVSEVCGRRNARSIARRSTRRKRGSTRKNVVITRRLRKKKEKQRRRWLNPMSKTIVVMNCWRKKAILRSRTLALATAKETKIGWVLEIMLPPKLWRIDHHPLLVLLRHVAAALVMVGRLLDQDVAVKVRVGVGVEVKAEAVATAPSHDEDVTVDPAIAITVRIAGRTLVAMMSCVVMSIAVHIALGATSAKTTITSMADVSIVTIDPVHRPIEAETEVAGTAAKAAQSRATAVQGLVAVVKKVGTTGDGDMPQIVHAVRVGVVTRVVTATLTAVRLTTTVTLHINLRVERKRLVLLLDVLKLPLMWNR